MSHLRISPDRIVDANGAGTDLTLASALAGLPVNGGTVYVRAGTYPISSTMVLPLKNVTIIGGGGNAGGPLVDPSATVFDLGANAIPLFQTPSGGGGATFASYKFVGFKVVGTSVLGQTFIQAPPAALGSSIIGENLQIDSVQMIVQTNGQSVDVTFRDCTLNPTTASASMWNGASAGGELTWSNVQGQLPVAGSAIAIAGGPTWNVTNSYLGGGGGPSTFVVQDINWVAFFLGKNADKATVTVSAAISTFTSCQFIGVSLIINTTLLFGSNSWFSGSSTGANAQLTLNGVAGIGNMELTGVNFDASGAAASNGVIVGGVTNVDITGCQFEGHTTDGIHITGTSTLSVTGCRFSETVPVNEVTTTVTGRYTGNDGFANSVIQGANSVVEGMRRFDNSTGLTTDLYVTQFTHQNIKGLLGIGTIVNTSGANSLDIAINTASPFGLGSGGPFTLTAGNSLMLSEQINIGGNFPPYTSYSVAVRSTTSGSPTGFALHHGSQGAT